MSLTIFKYSIINCIYVLLHRCAEQNKHKYMDPEIPILQIWRGRRRRNGGLLLAEKTDRVGHKYRESSPVQDTDNSTIPLSKACFLLSNYSNSCRIFKLIVEFDRIDLLLWTKSRYMFYDTKCRLPFFSSKGLQHILT